MFNRILRSSKVVGGLANFKYTNFLAFTVLYRVNFLSMTNIASTTMESDESLSAAFITCGSIDEAKKLSSGLVTSKLVACVNIIPNIVSVYEWEGKVNEDSEVLLMLKTRTNRIDDVSAYIREHHSYDVAEVISMKIDNGNPPYLDWVLKSIPTKGS